MSTRSYLVELGRVVDDCIDNVNDALRTMGSISNEVTKIHKDCNISQTVGTSVKGLGVFGIITGVIFPPLAIAGVIAVGAGTVSNIITEAVRTGKNLYVYILLFVPKNALATKNSPFNAPPFFMIVLIFLCSLPL